MSYGTNHITNTTAAVFIPEIWTRDIAIATESNIVIAKNCHRVSAVGMKKGDQYHLPNISNSDALDKVAETAINFVAPTETETILTIDKHKYSAYMFEDFTEEQQDYNLRKMYTDRAGYAMAKALETDLSVLYATWTTTPQGVAGSDLTKAVILDSQAELDASDVPQGDRAWIIHSSQKSVLLSIADLTYVSNVGNQNQEGVIRTGAKSSEQVFDLFGDPCYYTNFISQTGAAPVNTHNLYFHKEAIAYGMQKQPKVEKERVLEYLSDALVVQEIYGVTAWRLDHGVEVLS